MKEISIRNPFIIGSRYGCFFTYSLLKAKSSITTIGSQGMIFINPWADENRAEIAVGSSRDELSSLATLSVF